MNIPRLMANCQCEPHAKRTQPVTQTGRVIICLPTSVKVLFQMVGKQVCAVYIDGFGSSAFCPYERLVEFRSFSNQLNPSTQKRTTKKTKKIQKKKRKTKKSRTTVSTN